MEIPGEKVITQPRKSNELDEALEKAKTAADKYSILTEEMDAWQYQKERAEHKFELRNNMRNSLFDKHSALSRNKIQTCPPER